MGVVLLKFFRRFFGFLNRLIRSVLGDWSRKDFKLFSAVRG